MALPRRSKLHCSVFALQKTPLIPFVPPFPRKTSRGAGNFARRNLLGVFELSGSCMVVIFEYIFGTLFENGFSKREQIFLSVAEGMFVSERRRLRNTGEYF